VDLRTAQAILGIEPSATFRDAEAAYRGRARLVHPDRAAEPDQAEATRAMAQLNEAWTIVRSAYDTAAIPDSSRPESQPTAVRSPGAGECQLCGWAPARSITLHRTGGFLIFWNVRHASLNVCRTCGDAIYHQMQASSLVRGWWGVPAVVVNVVNLTRNRAAIGRHRRACRAPATREPGIRTDATSPLTVRSAWRRPGPIIATLAAAVLVGSAISSYIQHPPGSTTTIRIPPAPGDCVTSVGAVVNCADTTAAFTLLQLVPTPDDCYHVTAASTAFTDDESGLTYCAKPIFRMGS
jgi:hypothetical protein